MIRHPRNRTNWNSLIEVVIGGLAWASVCFIMWWAVFTMLEAYTK